MGSTAQLLASLSSILYNNALPWLVPCRQGIAWGSALNWSITQDAKASGYVFTACVSCSGINIALYTILSCSS